MHKIFIIAHNFTTWGIFRLKDTTVRTGRSPVTWAGQRWRWDEAGQLVVYAQHWPIHPGCSVSPATCAHMQGKKWWGLKDTERYCFSKTFWAHNQNYKYVQSRKNSSYLNNILVPSTVVWTNKWKVCTIWWMTKALIWVIGNGTD